MLPRLHRRRLTCFLAAAIVLLACRPACAGAPTERLREFVARVNAILEDPAIRDAPLERVVRVRRLVAEIADMPAAAANALGPEWEARTGAEREEFTTIFAEVLERAYVGRLAGAVRAAGGMMISYGDEVVSGDDATVHTALRGLGGHDLRVDYRMTRAGGRWRVRDIVVDGVSTVENYRAQFTRVLRRGAYAGLLGQLRAKLSEDTLMFAKSPRSAPAIVSLPAPEPEPAAAPVQAAPPVAPRVVASRPIVRAAPTPHVAPSHAAPTPRAVMLSVAAAPAAIAARPRPAEPVAEKPAEIIAATSAAVAASPAMVRPRDVPDPMGQLLGGLLLGVVGAGGALVWSHLSARIKRRVPRLH